MDLLVSFIADWLVFVIVILGGLTYLFYVRKDRYQQYARAAIAGLTALVAAKIMSIIFIQGERPFVQMGVDAKASFLNNPGFPSDHALFVFTITFVVYAATKKLHITLVLLGLSILVAFGRVLALVHTPADVIGGVVAAAIGIYIWYGKNIFKKN